MAELMDRIMNAIYQIAKALYAKIADLNLKDLLPKEEPTA